MTLLDITNLSNEYTDETATVQMARGFINTAISRINAELKTKLPLIDDVEEYTYIGTEWIHTVIIPYVCWSIKMNDGSLNEARMYEIQFKDGLEILKFNKKTAIDKEYYKDGSSNMYTIKPYAGMSNMRNNRPSSNFPLGGNFEVKKDGDK